MDTIFNQDFIDMMGEGKLDEDAMFDADPIVGPAMDDEIDKGIEAENSFFREATMDEMIDFVLNIDE